MREAVHIRTAGFYCGACPKVVEKAVGVLPGVIDVVSVRSLGLTSVLYDPDRIDREMLCRKIRQSGFRAEVLDSEAGKERSGDWDRVAARPLDSEGQHEARSRARRLQSTRNGVNG